LYHSSVLRMTNPLPTSQQPRLPGTFCWHQLPSLHGVNGTSVPLFANRSSSVYDALGFLERGRALHTRPIHEQLNASWVLPRQTSAALLPIQLESIAVTQSISHTSVRTTLGNPSWSGSTTHTRGRGVGGCHIVAGPIMFVFRDIPPCVPRPCSRASGNLRCIDLRTRAGGERSGGSQLKL
jgi:hypothetical protein